MLLWEIHFIRPICPTRPTVLGALMGEPFTMVPPGLKPRRRVPLMKHSHLGRLVQSKS
jgi:hypothetical protein